MKHKFRSVPPEEIERNRSSAYEYLNLNGMKVSEYSKLTEERKQLVLKELKAVEIEDYESAIIYRDKQIEIDIKLIQLNP